MLPPAGLGSEARDAEKLARYQDGELAGLYEQRWRGRSGARRDARDARAITAALETLGAAARGFTLLDVPCGTGRMVERAALCGARYLGLDLSPAMLGEARRRHGAARFALADLARLPLADGSVDVALCVRLLHLVRGRELRLAFLRELRRVARAGVVLEVRQAEALRPALRRARARLGLLPRAPANLTRAALTAELAEAGLAPLGFFPVRRPSWLSDRVLVAARGARTAAGLPG